MNRCIRVLIADDRRHSRNGLRVLLNSWPSVEVVCEAFDGLEAVQLVDDHQPDVVLMDVRMPVMDGLEATRLIKSKWPAIKVILLSICAQYRAEATAVGADGFFVKGCPTEELQRAISSHGKLRNRAEKEIRHVVIQPACAGLTP
jgi:DNA-binding NarL/FixJ family response regulator